MQRLEDILGEAGALRSLPPEHLAAVAGCARLRGFAPGERLLRAGEPADAFFVIRSGMVSVLTDVPGRGEVTIETLRDGELLGWSWLVPPYRTAFGARALDATRVVEMDGACLREKCESDPALGFDLLRIVATVFVHRLEEARIQLLDLYALSHRGR
jgi:CRP-like cAMP-binding protein